MTIANGILFGLGPILFWLLAYIQKPIMQKLYFRVIAWIIPASWIFAFWTLIAFIVGGVQNGGNAGHNILYWFIYVIGFGAAETLAWWQAPSLVKFYRWSEQEWWNYTKDESPQNWPNQMAGFINFDPDAPDEPLASDN